MFFFKRGFFMSENSSNKKNHGTTGKINITKINKY